MQLCSDWKSLIKKYLKKIVLAIISIVLIGLMAFGKLDLQVVLALLGILVHM